MNPDAEEVCDGADNDCDDGIDVDATDALAWHADADADGYGDADAPTLACDDASSTVSPAATEVCDAANVDEDCDRLADDADGSATGKYTWYRDADSDGYAGTTTTSACEQPSGYLATSTDCNDGSVAISPENVEACDPSDTDEDCDGLADDLDSDATGETTWYRDADSDTYGNAAVSSSRCDVPAGYVANDDDCDDTTGTIGSHRTWYRDADSDGYGLSTNTSSSCTQPSGYVNDYLVYAPVSGTFNLGGADAKLRGGSSADWLGYNLNMPGDVDGDGHDDILAAAYGQDAGGSAAGALYLVTSPATGTVSSVAVATIVGENTGDFLGGTDAGSFGDVDGDGQLDLVVGSYSNDDNGTDAGSVWLVYGPLSGTIDLHSADAEWLGTSAGDYFGYKVAILPDGDGDGQDEIVMGAPVGDERGYVDHGAVWIWNGD